MRRATAMVAALVLGVSMSGPSNADVLVVGIDTKFGFDDTGHRVFKPDTGDVVQFYDLADPAHPSLIGSLPLSNSVVGPPTNLAVTPDGKRALIASSILTEQGPDGSWRPRPDDRVFVVDLNVRPVRLQGVVKVGLQPSGIAISRKGDIALVANRAGKSVTVLSLDNTNVAVTGTVPMNDVVTSAAFSPDGKRALVAKFASHRVAVLDVEGGTVRPTGRDMLVGQFPYTVTVTADGRWGLAGSDAEEATSHGDVNPIAVMDLRAEPPRTVDFLAAGDGVEGVVASPRGALAAATILQGSLDAPRDAWYRHTVGRVVLLRIGADKVSVADSVNVRAFPEGVAFSRDGRWIYVGNFGSNSISVLHVMSGRLVNTHSDVHLPGPPAALRAGSS